MIGVTYSPHHLISPGPFFQHSVSQYLQASSPLTTPWFLPWNPVSFPFIPCRLSFFIPLFFALLWLPLFSMVFVESFWSLFFSFLTKSTKSTQCLCPLHLGPPSWHYFIVNQFLMKEDGNGQQPSIIGLAALILAAPQHRFTANIFYKVKILAFMHFTSK